ITMPQQISIFDLAQNRQNPTGGGHIIGKSIIQFNHTYDDIISLENLLEAWKEFRKDKRSRKDVQEFERDLMSNIMSLHSDLDAKTYRHSSYEAFKVNDPKPRDIHKATVRDRLLHRALYRKLYPFFNRIFISDSTSCRLEKGTHKAVNRFRVFARKASFNHTKTVWVLKCDIRKFFASIDQTRLLAILARYILDKDILSLISIIIGSFHSTEKGIGLPLGNLTSQLFVNIYMNEFDQFMKHRIKAKYYIRYSDDFVIISRDRDWLVSIISRIRNFLWYELKLQLHPNKVSIGTITSGIDYLGWVNFNDHRVLRTSTKRRMFKRIQLKQGKRETVQSYLGMIGHGNCRKVEMEVRWSIDDLPKSLIFSILLSNEKSPQIRAHPRHYQARWNPEDIGWRDYKEI
ncbi:MAG: reverse transcriptase/maturase family protein, partial [Candidatus Taylorbacteria bacterium]|nr:reverse transcriptase/maturase family protein [Candidatus Taylorbacteria bacterium]